MLKFNNSLLAVVLLSMAVTGAHASAPTYDFNVNYFGNNNASLAVGSDDPMTVVLSSGDSFAYRLIANGSGQWNTNSASSVFPLFALTGNFGNTQADFTLNLWNNGSIVFTFSENNAVTCCAHLGTNSVSVPIGTIFDEIELIDIISSTANAGAADSLLPWPGQAPEFHSPSVFSYTADTSNVPEPASLALLGLGLAGIAISRRRKQLQDR